MEDKMSEPKCANPSCEKDCFPKAVSSVYANRRYHNYCEEHLEKLVAFTDSRRLKKRISDCQILEGLKASIPPRMGPIKI